MYNRNFAQDDSPSAHQRPSSPLPCRLCQCSRYVALIIALISGIVIIVIIIIFIIIIFIVPLTLSSSSSLS